MNKPITIVLFEDPEAWIRNNVPDMFTDHVSAVFPIIEFNPDGLTEYKDFEEDTTKQCSLEDHIEALRLLCMMIGKELFVGNITNPGDLKDLTNWDAEVVDAFFQLVYRKKVLYG